MIKKYFCMIALALNIFSSVNCFSQCPDNNTLWADLTPPGCPGTLYTSCIFGGEYCTVNVISGNIYTFQTCGDTDFDTYITVYNNSTGALIAYNDDACGSQSSVAWTANFSGIVRVLVSNYDCGNEFSCMSLSVSCSLPSTNYNHPTTGLQSTYCGASTVNISGSNYYDNGGAGGNYSSNINNIFRTFCPSVPGTCIRATITAMDMEPNGGGCYDYLQILNGPSQTNPMLWAGCNTLASPNTTAGVFSNPFTSTDPSGCMGFRFMSDAVTVKAGWAITLSCVPCGGGPSVTENNDCYKAIPLCGNTLISNPSTGPGLNPENAGCVVSENYSDWFTFTINTGGTLGITIDPVNDNDDYDFAIWGPDINCANINSTSPLRCSYAINTSNTGMGNGAVDNSETAMGDGWVSTINVTAGQTYKFMVNKFDSGGSGFNLIFTGTAAVGNPTGLITVNPDRSCQGDGSGTACAVFNSGAPPLSYSWNGGQSTQCINNLSSGVYTMTVIDGNGCSFVDSAVVRIEPLFTDTSLVAWYPFNGNASDFSGHGNHGTVMGAAYTADRYGNSGSACSFDGTSQYIEFPNPLPVDVPALTVSAWINIPSLTNYNDNAVIHAAGSSEWALYYHGSKLYYNIKLSDNNWYADSANIPDAGEWIFLTASYQRADKMKFYVNGTFVMESNVPDSNFFEPSSVNSAIGCYNDPLLRRNYFSGMADDIRIYNRALTPQEVNALYKENMPAFITAQPVSDTVCYGDLGRLTISATGEEPLNYQWFHGGTPVAGSNNDTLFLENASIADSGYYYCKVWNTDTVNSTPAHLLVDMVLMTITKSDESCYATNNGIATANLAGGISPFTFLWSNGNSGNEVTDLAPGNYSLTVTDSFGCSESQSITIAPAPGLSPGMLDCTFDGDGIVTIDFFAGYDKASAVAIQPDGKIVTAGLSNNGANTDFAIARCNYDGSPDSTFSDSGRVVTPIGAGFDNGNAMVIQPDGKIVVAGYSNNGANNDFAVVRYNSDGSLDTDFSTDGIVTTPIGSANDEANAMVLQSNGKIVVAGYTDAGANKKIALVRYNTDGSLDNTFGGSGIRQTSVGSADVYGYSVTLYQNKIIVAGYTDNAGVSNFAVVRYTIDGALDDTFSDDGIIETDIGSATDKAYSVTVQQDGKILVTGFTASGTPNKIALVRYTAEGVPDNSFDTDGIATYLVGSTSSVGRSVAVQPDDKIVVAGHTFNGTNWDFAAIRCNADGTLDNTFSGDGTVMTPIANSTDEGYAVAIQDDGKIVVAGEAAMTGGYQFALVRYMGSESALTISTVVTNTNCNGSYTGIVDLTISGGISPFTYHWSNDSTTQDLSGVNAGTYYVTVTDNVGQIVIDSATITEPAYIETYTDTIAKILHDGRNCIDYPIVKIDNRWWMRENLDIGNMISSTTSGQLQTDNATIEKYCYDNDPANCEIYGGLYEWNEMMQYAPSDTNQIGITLGVCPTGWHIPSDTEWQILIDSLGGDAVAGGKMKETGTSHWSSPNTDATNESGFTALPGGYRISDGSFGNSGGTGNFWSATENNSSGAWDRNLNYSNADANRDNGNKEYGLSVRCVKNTCPGAFITQTQYICQGDSIFSGGGWQTAGGSYYDTLQTTLGCDSIINTNLVVVLAGETVTDTINKFIHDGRDCHNYPIEKIGNQWWMAENLKVKKFRNGDNIADGTGTGDISGLTNPKLWFVYADNPANEDTYGLMYTWYAVNDNRHICTDGWHEPLDPEMQILFDELGGVAVAGGKLKQTGTVYWNVPNTGATNESGFTALPGGSRGNNGTFANLGNSGRFWSGTEDNATNAWRRELSYNSAGVTNAAGNKANGFSVRCLKNTCADMLVTIDTTICDGETVTVGSTTYTESGVYHDTLTSAGGCDSVIVTNLTVNSGPDASITVFPSSTICSGQQMTLTANNGYQQYSWSNGDAIYQAYPTPLTTTTYYLTATNNGCSNVDSVTITVNQTPVVNLGNDTIVCNANITLNATVAGGASPYNYNWNTACTDESCLVSTSGIYSITITDATGCTDADSINVTVLSDTTYTDTIAKILHDGRNCVDYPIEKIGNQWWMAENLNATRYSSGDIIPNITDNGIWGSISTGALCYYNNDSLGYAGTYGPLYNWYAVVDSHRICPAGWHVPTHYEWTDLEHSLCTSGTCDNDFPYDYTSVGWRGTGEGGKLKESGLAHWNSPNYGATDSTGFSAIPGGLHYHTGQFGDLGDYGYWWVADEYNSTEAWQRMLFKGDAKIYRGDGMKRYGSSIRCIKNEPLSISVSATNATCPGSSSGSASVAASGGTPPYTYLWNNGNSTDAIYGVSAGTYAVTVTDAASETAVGSVTITEPPALSTSISSTNVTTTDGNDGSIDLSVYGGTPPYSYNWSSGETDEDIFNLTAGNYSVTVTDNNLCNIMANVTITQPPAPFNCSGSFTDVRDGKIYGTVLIGNQCWMKQNLNVGTRINGTAQQTNNAVFEKYCYNNLESNCDLYGGLYQWNELVNYTPAITAGICPTGWHIPADGEWFTLEHFVDTTINNPTAMNWHGTDAGAKLKMGGSTGFDAKLSGYCSSGGDGSFYDLNNKTFFWTTTESTPGFPFIRLLDNDHTEIFRGPDNGNTGFSVRCLKNDWTMGQLYIDGTNATCNEASTGSATVTVEGGAGTCIYLWSTGDTTENISGLAAGLYFVTVTNNLNNIAVDSIEITEPSPVPVEAGAEVTVCYGDSIALFGTGAMTYVWSNGIANGIAFPHLATATYYVTGTDASGCTNTDSIIANVNPNPVITATVNNATCYNSANGSIDLNVSGGTSPYSYSWSNGSTQSAIYNLQSAIYSITASDVNGCASIEDYTITEPLQIEINGVVTNVTGATAGDGSIDITPVNGGSPFIYSWSDGASTEDISNLSPGIYSITVTDNNSCSNTATFTVTGEYAYFSYNTNNVCAPATISFTNLSTTGVFYAWYFGTDGPYYVYDSVYTFSHAGEFNVICAALDSTGNLLDYYSDHISVKGSTGSFVMTTDSACVNNDFIFYYEPNGPADYTWDYGDGIVYTGNSVAIHSFAATGTYNVSLILNNECGIDTIVQQVIISNDVTVHAEIYSSSAACPDEFTEFFAVGSAGTYTWDFGDGTTISTGVSYVTHIFDTVGTYYVEMSVTNSCGNSDSVIDTIVISGGSYFNPDISFTVSPDTGCAGDLMRFKLSSDYYPTVIWNFGDGTVDTTNAITFHEYAANGIYYVSVTVINGCGNDTTLYGQAIIQYNAGAGTDFGTFGILPEQACPGDTIVFHAVNGAASYLWNFGDGFASPGEVNVNQEVATFHAYSDTGTYVVTLTRSNSCGFSHTDSVNINIGVNTEINLPFNESFSWIGRDFGPSYTCQEVTFFSFGGSEYTWDFGDGTTLTSGEVFVHHTYVTAGIYLVSVSVQNSCGYSQTTNSYITVIGACTNLVASITGTNVTCFGGSDGTAVVTAYGGTQPYSYVWSNAAITSNISNLVAGSYSVTVTDADSNTATASVVIDQPPPLAITISNDTAICYGQSVLLCATGGNTYIWNTLESISCISVTPLSNETYYVTVTDSNGCHGYGSVAVTVNPVPVVDLGIDINSCGAPTVDLDAGYCGTCTYLWSNGATSELTTVSSSGDHSVTVTNNYGCTDSDTVNVFFDSGFTTQINFNNVLCYGEASGSATVVTNPPGTDYSYDWSNGVTTAANNGISAGTYTVAITNYVTGCQGYDTVTITEPSLLEIIDIIGSAVTGGCNGSAEVTVTGGTTSYTYLWSSGGNLPQEMNLCSGLYYITVTDSNGCTDMDSVSINDLPMFSASIDSFVNVSCYGGHDGYAMVTATGGQPPFTYLWSNGPVGSVVAALGSGSYTVTVTDASSATASATVTITEPAQLVLTISETDEYCNNNMGTASASVTGGISPYTYLWATGDSAMAIDSLSAGIYMLTITDANGCSTSNTTVIINSSPLTATITGNLALTCFGNHDGFASVTPAGGTAPYTYLWNDQYHQTLQTAMGLKAGIYTVSITDAQGCSLEQVVSITEPAKLLINATVTPSSCGHSDGSALATVTGGTPPYVYQWNCGDSTSVADSLSAGAYILTVTDNNLCSDFKVVAVNDYGAAVITVNSVTNVSCHGNSNGAIDITVSGATPPYLYHWSNGATTQDIGSLAAGPYEINVRDANGCTSVKSILVTEPPELIATTSGSNATCGLSDATAVAHLWGGTPPYTYSWSNGGTDSIATGLGSGTHHVTLTDSHGCYLVNNVAISEDGAPIVNLDSVVNVHCGDTGGSVYINVTGSTGAANYTWSNGATVQDMVNVLPGNYSVTISDASGCQSVLSAEISMIAPEEAPLCIVTVDSATHKNLVVWERPISNNIAFYNVWKESTQAGVYFNVTTVPYDSLSVFVDTLSDPLQRSWRYKLTMTDTCGNESELSPEHKTIHLTVNQGIGNTINLIWDHYEGFSYSTYYIYRKKAQANWALIDSIASNLHSYTNNIPTAGKWYYIVVAKRGDLCSPAVLTKTQIGPYSQSVSNIDDNGIIDIGVYEITQAPFNVDIYPNPAYDKITVEFSNWDELSNATWPVLVQVYDISGRLVIEKNFTRTKEDIEISSFAGSMYAVKVNTSQGVVVKRFVKK